jgi:MbtH protein
MAELIPLPAGFLCARFHFLSTVHLPCAGVLYARAYPASELKVWIFNGANRAGRTETRNAAQQFQFICGDVSNRKGDANMPRDEDEDNSMYKVVVNHEEQYSIWPADRENPLGWQDVGKIGLKPECLAYIKEVWTDMRPLSLRKRMEALAKQGNS